VRNGYPEVCFISGNCVNVFIVVSGVLLNTGWRTRYDMRVKRLPAAHVCLLTRHVMTRTRVTT